VAAASFHLRVVTPDDVPFDGQVLHVMPPGALGYLGVLKDHAPLVTPITKGRLSFREEDGTESFFRVEGGFLEVYKNRVLVLTDKVEGKISRKAG